MKTPDCVVWALTKKNNAFIKKSNGNSFSSHPLNLTGFHNASQSANTLGVSASTEESKAKKGNKRVFTLNLKHKSHHRITKRKSQSQSKLAHSEHAVRSEVNHAAKSIQGLTFQNDNTKKAALRRLARLHSAMPTHIKA